MKWSNTILLTILAIGLAGLFGTNALMKKEYNRIDKTDKYWNFLKLTEQPFKYVKITGGNVSNIVYEQTPNYSVKVMSAWHGSTDGTVKAVVANDTLNIDFKNTYKDIYEKFWLKDAVTLRISSPALESISGLDTKVSMNKFTQPSLKVDMHGNSRLAVNCYRNNFDRLDVNQGDSSVTVFIMSNDAFTNDIIRVKELNATGRGVSLLNMRASIVEHLNLDMGDSASIALSGYSLGKWNTNK